MCYVGFFSLKIEDCEGGHLIYRVIIQVNMVMRNSELAGSSPDLFEVNLIAYSRMKNDKCKARTAMNRHYSGFWLWLLDL
jgi:hypothetical protein